MENENLALHKSTSQSSTLNWAGSGTAEFMWNSSYAVDGNKDKINSSVIEHIPCCSGTKGTPWKPWWQVDLSDFHVINRVDVYGRASDTSTQLRGFNLYISEQSGIRTADTLVYKDSTTHSDYIDRNGHITVSHIFRFGRYVSIEMTNRFTNGKQESLVLCEVEVYAENLALHKNTSQSSTLNWAGSGTAEFMWNSSYAVDGNKDKTNSSVIEHIPCCSGTNGTPWKPWWQVDLGDFHVINRVDVYGRASDTPTQLRGFDLYIAELSGMRTPDNLVYSDSTTHSDYLARYGHITISQLSRFGRYVSIEMTNRSTNGKQQSLILCEVEVYADDCPVGTFGLHCLSYCNCIDLLPCNRTDGVCRSPGCKPGWQGASCDTVCEPGLFGQNCSSDCHCWHNKSCDNTIGSCPQDLCAPGWQGNNCSIECGAGEFGQNCSFACHCRDNKPCDRINGSCPDDMCAPGWKANNCSLECDTGEFGQNCSFPCRCLDNKPCDRTNGSCPDDMCAPGWKGNNCSLECDTGEFGKNCSFSCHCFDNKPCHNSNGSCPDDMCAPGWKGDNCSLECDAGEFGQNCSFPCHCLDNKPCHRTNGNCPDDICAPGWKGDNCSLECDAAEFGQNCSFLCHCFDNKPCHRINGSCPDDICAPGWKGNNCSLDCGKQTFGLGCSSPCHCVEEYVCDHVYGSCAKGGCITGWEGNNCSIKAKPLTQPKDNGNVGVIIGPVVAFVTILIVVAVIILYRKRLSHDKSETTHQTFTGIKDKMHMDKKISVKKTLRQDRHSSDTETVHVIDDHTYYSFVSDARSIEIKDLWDHINTAYNTDCKKLYQEFQKLPQGLVNECKEGKRLENAKKNRYKGMFAYDHSRVILNKDYPDESSYINACYIDGFDMPKKFIASQGPTEYMAADFWHMVIQERSKVLVMLTNVVEHGVRKCIQYWPGEESEEQTFGDVTVRTSKITPFPDYIIRELEIATKTSRKPKRVTQAHFTAWPDKDVPDAAWHLVNFWRKVCSLVGETKSPIVIHCSAGVGRTGTYIALDNLHMQANNEGCVNPYETVLRLRQQRVNMVQTKEQYVFLHEAVAEALFIGVKSVKTNDFEAVFKSMTQPDKDQGKSGLEQQFRMAQEIWSKTEGESEYSYVSSAREIDEYKPKTTTASSSNNEDDNEVFHVQNYAGKETFILTNVSGKNLRELAKKHNIKTVIAFQNEDDREKVDKEIKQFTFRGWIKGTTVPTDTQSIIALLNAVQKWQPTFDGTQPILINDTSGYKMCGIVCLLLCEFERIRLKGEVNVLSAIKQMKDGHSLLIANYEQYKFCYSAILDYIRQSDVYMNVGTTVEATAWKTKQIVED